MRLLVLTCSLLLALQAAADAEASLTDYNGSWTGQGQDRDMPFQSLQATECRARVSNDATHMNATIVCNGVEGLHKRMRVSLAFADGSYTGNSEMTSSGPGRDPVRRAGKVSGEGTVELANLTVTFPGLLPNASVVLRRTSPTSFTMKVTTLGSTLTDLEFRRH
jgi:hypothetical protein